MKRKLTGIYIADDIVFLYTKIWNKTSLRELAELIGNIFD